MLQADLYNSFVWFWFCILHQNHISSCGLQPATRPGHPQTVLDAMLHGADISSFHPLYYQGIAAFDEM